MTGVETTLHASLREMVCFAWERSPIHTMPMHTERNCDLKMLLCACKCMVFPQSLVHKCICLTLSVVRKYVPIRQCALNRE